MSSYVCMVCKDQTHLTHADADDDNDLCSYCKDKIIGHFKSVFPKLSPDGRVMYAASLGLHLYKD